MTEPGTPRAAVIAGTGAAVPAQVVTNDDFAARLDTSDEWIRTRTGIAERRIAPAGLATGDLAVAAGRQALDHAESERVDAVVLATTTPDHRCPATAPAVAARLGCAGAMAFDVTAVCSGFVYALAAARGLIAAGTADSVLVVAADTFSTIVDPQDRTVAPIFGDGAGAMVLRPGSAAEPGAVLGLDLGSDGDRADLIMTAAGGSRHPDPLTAAPSARFMTMKGREVFIAAVERMSASTRTVLERTGWLPGDLDLLVAHQANLRIMRAVAGQIGARSELAFADLDRFGNTAGASIPLALHDAAARDVLRPGHRVAVTAFGGGATWGSATFVWPRIKHADVIEVEATPS